MTDQKNLLLAIVFSVAIIFAFQLFFPRESSKPAPQKTTVTAPATTPGKTPATTPGKTPATTPGKTPATTTAGVPLVPTLKRAQALKVSPRVAIESPRIAGSISLRGGRIDDVVLRDYWKTIKHRSNVDLLNPASAASAYFTDFGWYRGGTAATPVLSGNEQWQVVGNRTLAPGKPVTLTLTRGKLTFERTYSIDKDYMITVARKVTNNADQPVRMYPFSRIRLFNTPKTLGYFILHEGPIAVHRDSADSRGTQDEKNYSSIRDTPLVIKNSVGGWLGFTSHYWLVALVPEQKARVNGEFTFKQSAGDDKKKGWYTAEYTGMVDTLAPGKSVTVTSRVFAGAKEADLLAHYQNDLGISRFEWAIDWGWFWFFTKPFLWLIKWFYQHVGNFGLAIMLLTICVKTLFFPLANRSYKSMSRMKKLQPEVKRLRERYQDDKQRQNQEMMALYKREKVNPAAGCLPIVVQIPVFFALYKVLYIAIEMRQAPFFGWIQDLSVRDPTSIVNLFGALPWGVPTTGYLAMLNIGLWPLIMGVTMWLQQKLNPSPPDPMQQKIFMLLPIVFTIMLAHFPAGLVIYWAWNNSLSVCQQWLIMRRQGVYKGKPKTPTNIRDLQPKPETAGGDGGPDAGAETGGNGGAATAAAPARSKSAGRKSGSGGNRRRPSGGSRGGKRRR
jgi:YidC/Oxa1 family membrane protein insertase